MLERKLADTKSTALPEKSKYEPDRHLHIKWFDQLRLARLNQAGCYERPRNQKGILHSTIWYLHLHRSQLTCDSTTRTQVNHPGAKWQCVHCIEWHCQIALPLVVQFWNGSYLEGEIPGKVACSR
jgi:hypothetical protein